MFRKRSQDHEQAKRHAHVDRSMRANIFDGEEVVLVAHPGRLATLPKLVLTLGLYTFWRRRDTSVLTNQRILLGTGILGRRERSIPLAVIDDVAFTRRGVNSYADVTFHDRRSAAVRRIGPLTSRTAHRFTRETLRRL
jgi:Bacterial PH domain